MTGDLIVWQCFLSQFNGILIWERTIMTFNCLQMISRGKGLRRLFLKNWLCQARSHLGCVPPKQCGNLGNACPCNDTQKERDHQRLVASHYCHRRLINLSLVNSRFKSQADQAVFRGVFASRVASVQAKLWSNFSVTSLKIPTWREVTMVQKNTKLFWGLCQQCTLLFYD